MEQIFPSNLNNEIRRLNKHIKRTEFLDNVANITLIIVTVAAAVAIWTTLKRNIGNQAWQEGYEKGYEQAQWDFIDREINSKDYGTTYMEPTTDAEIWNTYHDCNMYGLPEYARPICKSKVQES